MVADFTEKRAFERVTKKFKVTVREVTETLFQHLLEVGDFHENPLEELADEEVISGATSDVSEGGLGLLGDLKLVGGRPLKVGKRLYIECFLDGSEDPVRALGTVMWTRPGEVPEAGFMFMGISEDDLAKVEALVKISDNDTVPEGG